jgi:uncharacterized protein (TIGR00299 family) protein
MQTLAFDGRMGASGDMLLGALVAAGADPAALAPVEDRLDVAYDIGTATRCGIEATDVTVRPTGKGDNPAEDGNHDDTDGGDHRDSHQHGESADGEHHDSHRHGHDHSHGGAEGAGPDRSFPEVLAVVESLDLPEAVEQDARGIFELLGEAEASVHGTDITETRFHEVGSDDAIADVVGAALLLADLDPDRVVTTTLSTGGGTVGMHHGEYPVPAPAVVELAATADWSVRGGPVESELLTPTGAAVLAHVAAGVDSLPDLDIAASGYGAGDRSFDRHPNVLRALVGETTALRQEPVTVLETNLDDATPEVLGALQDRLVDAGALDVATVPMTMKKSRPGHLVKVVVAPEDARQVARRLAAETGTLGIREHGSGHRFVADRERRSVTVPIGQASFELTVKVASLGGTVYDVSAELDDALTVARETDRPVREVRRRAERAARDEMGSESGRTR